MNLLWTADRNSGYIMSPDGELKLRILNDDVHFARALCHLLNSSPVWKMQMTEEEMNLRGIPSYDKR